MVEYIHYTKSKGPKLFKFGKYSFSTTEIIHLTFALIMITATLMLFQKEKIKYIGFINFIIINLLTIGLGFVLHELGHKFVAQHFGFISEFRADFFMLTIIFIFALFSPILFLAPGAVLILGRPTRRENGIISVAGPLVNLTLATIFLLISFIFKPYLNDFTLYIIWLGIWVNSFLGIFNMLPFWVLDGKKVLTWNKTIYFTVLIPLIFFLVGSFNNRFI